MRVVEVNLNLRVEKGMRSMDYSIDKDIGRILCDITPEADIYAMVEYMKCRNEEFLEQFYRKGYHLVESLDKDNRGILVGVKGYDIEKICEFSSPHFIHLRLKSGGLEIDLIVMRILVGCTLNEKEFKERREQFFKALRYIKTIPSQSMIITGDFNNANIRDDYRGYVQQCYNYQFIIEQFKECGLRLIHVDGYSYKGYFKEDHIVLGESFIEKKVEYKKNLFDGGKNTIGYPDHVPLVADIALSE